MITTRINGAVPWTLDGWAYHAMRLSITVPWPLLDPTRGELDKAPVTERTRLRECTSRHAGTYAAYESHGMQCYDYCPPGCENCENLRPVPDNRAPSGCSTRRHDPRQCKLVSHLDYTCISESCVRLPVQCQAKFLGRFMFSRL